MQAAQIGNMLKKKTLNETCSPKLSGQTRGRLPLQVTKETYNH